MKNLIDKTNIHEAEDDVTELGSQISRDHQGKKTKRKFSGKRIQTMFNPEVGWCRWNEEADDYIYDPNLNYENQS